MVSIVLRARGRLPAWFGPRCLMLFAGCGLGLLGAPVSADENDRAHAPPQAQIVPPAEHGAPAPLRYRFGGHNRSGVNVFIAPRTEHWPSNYVPDNYRLQGYDGRPDRPSVCRGDSGTTISTAGGACPEGQQPATGGRSWSTSP